MRATREPKDHGGLLFPMQPVFSPGSSVRAFNLDSKYNLNETRWHIAAIAGLYDYGHSWIRSQFGARSKHSTIHPPERNLRQGFGKEGNSSERYSNVSVWYAETGDTTIFFNGLNCFRGVSLFGR